MDTTSTKDKKRPKSEKRLLTTLQPWPKRSPPIGKLSASLLVHPPVTLPETIVENLPCALMDTKRRKDLGAVLF